MGDYKLLEGADIENGINETSSSAFSLASQEMYPEATEKQAKLLSLLDEATTNAMPKIEAPQLGVEKLKLSDFKSLLSLLKFPATALVALSLICFAIVAINNSFLLLAAPYWIGFANFVSSFPGFRHSFNDISVLVIVSVDTLVEEITSSIDDLEVKVTKILSEIKEGIENVLIPIRPKLKKALKMEGQLKRIDNEIEIPDPREIEEELNHTSDKLSGSLDRVKEEIDIEKYIPKAAKSKKDFDLFIFYPVLALYLVLQMVIVYFSSQIGEASVQEVNYDKVQNLLRGFFVSSDLEGDNSILMNTDSIEILADLTNSTGIETFGELLSDHVVLFIVCLLSFLTSITSVSLVFFFSRESLINRGINFGSRYLTKRVNFTMGESLTQPFGEVFKDSMTTIKEKLLNMIDQMERIEGPMARCNFLGL